MALVRGEQIYGKKDNLRPPNASLPGRKTVDLTYRQPVTCSGSFTEPPKRYLATIPDTFIVTDQDIKTSTESQFKIIKVHISFLRLN